MDLNDDFGKGIFDNDTSEDVAVEDREPIKLTDDDIAVASRDFLANEEPADWQEVGDSDGDADEPDETDDEPVSWEPSDSDTRLGRVYGLTEAQMESFGSSESLGAAFDLLESQRAKETSEDAGGPDQSVSSDVQGGNGAAGSLKKVDIKALEEKFASKDDDGNPLYEKEHTDLIVEQTKATNAVIDELNGMKAERAEQQRTTEQAATLKAFNESLDEIPGLYGKLKTSDGSDLSRVQKKNREEIGLQVATLAAGHKAQGREIPPLDELIKQSVRSVHGEKMAGITKRSENLRKQSGQRRRAGTKQTRQRGKPVNQSKDPHDPDVIANDPEIVRFMENAELENGSRI